MGELKKMYMKNIEKPELYKPFVSKAKNKKYSVFVKANNKKGYKIIHFGDKRYEHFSDKLKFYKHLDHKDEKRKKNYYARHGKDKGKDTSKYWSHKILW